MTAKKRKESALSFESLESKQMLAGDVVVSMIGGNLNITGDDDANQVAITSGEDPGSYLIRGLDGTTVSLASDGGGEPPTATENVLLVEGVRGDVNVRLRGGDDLVAVNDANIRRNLNIATGEGSDHVRIGARPETDVLEPLGDDVSEGRSVRVGGSLRISTGSNNDSNDDSVVVDDTQVRQRLLIATGAGEDTVRIGRPETTTPVPPTEANEDLAKTQEQTQPNQQSNVLVGGGVKAHLGQDNDRFSTDGLTTRRIQVNGGAGEDTILVNDARARAISLLGGRGVASDSIDVQGARASILHVRTGAGDDAVRIIDSAFSTIGVALGAGDDLLAMGDVQARRAALFGGPGEEDRYRDLGENMISRQVIQGFELPPVDDSEDDEESPTDVTVV